MTHSLGVLICFFLLEISIRSFSGPITMNTSTSQTITNFNTDLGVCSCDISTACDVFCCCDSNCDTAKVDSWTTSNWCGNNSVQIEKLCYNIGKNKGYSSFQDLGCVFYSNRGNIGEFYLTPSSTNFIDPNIAKFATRNSNAMTTQQYSVAAASKYQQNSAIKIKVNNIIKPLIVYMPSLGQSCRKSYVGITQGTYNYQCLYSVTSDSCSKINEQIGFNSNIIVCLKGDCSTTSDTQKIISSATLANNNQCQGIINQITLSATIEYIGSQYIISTPTLSISSPVDINVPGKVLITTTIVIQKAGSSLSGKPGYIIGKPLIYSSGTISLIGDSTKNCLLASNVQNNKLNIKFGINETFTCLIAPGVNPCSSSLYIDTIALGSSFKFLKYASKTTQQITVEGLSATSCLTQSFTLFILYSYSGWVLSPQYYILGSKIIANANANTNIRMKQLNVKWIKVEPQQISTPPTNNFYKYFQKLWLPLQSTFYNKISQEKYFIYSVFACSLLFLMIFY